MNKQELDILNALLEAPYSNQRELSSRTGHSLGVVNNAVKQLVQSLQSPKLTVRQTCL